jgi:hypothetical protein
MSTLCSNPLALQPSCPYQSLQHRAPYWFHSCDPPSCVPSSVTLACAARSGLAHTSQPMSVGMENWIPSIIGHQAEQRQGMRSSGLTSLCSGPGLGQPETNDKHAANRGKTRATGSGGREWRQPGMAENSCQDRMQTKNASEQRSRRLMSHLDESLQHGHLGKRNREVDVGCLCASTDV